MKKVREVISLRGWVDGSGWSYTQTYSDNIVDVPKVPMTAGEYDWSWYELPEDYSDESIEDTKIIVEFYPEDAEPGYDEPLAKISKWESDLWVEALING